MKFLATGDLQLHNHPGYAVTLPDGRSSRLAEAQQVLSTISKFAHANYCQHIVIAGDFWHQGARLPASLFDPVCKQLESLGENCGVKYHVIPGNHDIASHSGDVCGLSMFKGTEHVLVNDGDTQVKSPGGTPIVYIPFKQTLLELEDAIEHAREFGRGGVLVIHAGIRDTESGSDTVHGSYLIDPSSFIGFRLVIAGHHHKHAHGTFPGGEWVVPGSPLQINHSEENQVKGFISVNDDLSWKFHPIESPIFRTITLPNDVDELGAIFASSVQVYLKIRAGDASITRQTVEDIMQGTTVKWTFEPCANNAKPPRIDTIEASTSIETIVEQYTAHAHKLTQYNSLDLERLKKLGHSLLS